jgi:hypothetical protein
MGKNDLRKEILRPYTQIWTFPLKIYSFGNAKLPVSVNPWDVFYFIIGMAIVYIMTYISVVCHIPFYKIPVLFRYIIIPYIILKFFVSVKPDGKSPYKYFWGRIIFAFGCKKYEKFKKVKLTKTLKIDTSKIYFRARGTKE